jgi:hypothetical protein
MMKENMMHKDDMMKHTVSLENVVGSTTIRWITFNGNETWSASATSDTSGTHVYAHFDDLPSAWNNNFYEGWIVRTTNGLSVLSTGELEYKDGKYVNDWHTTDDIADHTFYVLTLEPNDGDPAPADHILEAHVK